MQLEIAGITVPAKYEVCWRCEGRGKHTNPSIDGNGITQNEMAELGPDFEEDYFSGVYDIRCSVCNGEKVTLEPDESRITQEQKDTIEEYHQDMREMEAERQAEIRMGC